MIALLIPLLAPAPACPSTPLDPSAARMGSVGIQPAQEPRVADLIARGRKLLDKGELEGALELFEQADAETQGSLATRMWVLRVWFATGRINDAFDQTDALGAKHKGPDLDYLYGMGSFLKAKTYITQGVPNKTTGFALQDAQTFLSRALEANPEKYYDAWLPLAEAAWLNQDPTAAEAAAEHAVERDSSPTTLYLQARILFSRYQILATDAKRKDDATAKLTQATAAFRQAIAGVKPSKEEAVRLADMYKNLGIALQWGEDIAGAETAYAASIGWNPAGFAFGDYWGSLGQESFTKALAAGAKQFVEHWGTQTASDATLLWWLGFAEYSGKNYQGAESHFASAVKKWPAYANSFFYVGMCRYHQADYFGAVEAWREHWARAKEDLVANVNASPELYLKVFEYVQGKCAELGQRMLKGKPARNLDAAFIGEVLCAADASNWKYWNDLGLFSRDGGAYLQQRDEKGDSEEATRLFERSFEAYAFAIVLAPDKAHLYNDQAVLLHYYLERDYDKAMSLYERALDLATRQLEAGGLDEETLLYTQTAKRDSQDNIKKLKRKLGDDKGGQTL